MKGLWLLLSALIGSVCVNAEHSDWVDTDTQVDLNGCLGWGPSDELADVNISGTELFPSNKGNFTQYCDSCHIIQEDESPTQVGYILCNCAQQDSDFKLEYMYDLKDIVEVRDDGCFACGRVDGTCSKRGAQEAPVPLEDDPITSSAIRARNHKPLLFVEFRNGTNISDCDGSISQAQEFYPNAIPATYEARPLRPCEENEGPGLCCYYTPGGWGYGELGFHFISDSTYIYRVEYGRDDYKRFTVLQQILRYCLFPDDPENCPGGEPDGDTGPTASPNLSTSVISSTSLPYLSTRPPRNATLDNRGNRALTTSRNVTGIPDIYFPTPTWPSGTLPSPKLASVSPALENLQLKIDVENLDALGMIAIMLEVTNVEEVGKAHLDLRLTTNCYREKKGEVICRKVVIDFRGHTLDNGTSGPLTCQEDATTHEGRYRSTTMSTAESYDSTENSFRTRTVFISTTATVTAPSSTLTAIVATNRIVSGAALPADLVKRRDMPLPHSSSSTLPPPRFSDHAQAVLGPRAVESTDELPAHMVSTVGVVHEDCGIHCQNLTPTALTSANLEGFKITTAGDSAAKPSVIVTYITEEELPKEGANTPSPPRTSSVCRGLMGCPSLTA